MASTKIQELKNLLKMGARANKYRIMLAAPVGATNDFEIDTLCKSASFPGKSIGTVEVFNQGRKIVVAWDAAYENTWTLTFWNDQEHKLKDQFDQWLLYIDNVETHSRGAAQHTDYMTETAKVEQLNTSDNSVMITYEFRNFWPTNLASIDLGDDQQDAIEEFSVDFAFSHWFKI